MGSWKSTFYGHVRVTVTGRLVEQFINRCVRANIKIWDVRRLNDNSLTCSIFLSDIKEIRKVLRATGCKIHFRERKGFPFVLSGLLSRTGLIVGLVGFLVVLFVLSNMIWNINVSGADPKVEHQIRTLLQKMDIHRGAMQIFLPSIEQTEYTLSQELKKVTWVGVSVDGTTLNVRVVQKEIPKKEKETGPQNLYAKKEAIIHYLFVEKGQPMVVVNQYVKPGDLLVSGKIGTEKEPKWVGAQGEIIGETWYHSETNVPLVRHLITYTGMTYEQYKVDLFGYEFPIWGFRPPHYKTSQMDVEKIPLHFLQWKLPLTFNKYTQRETIEKLSKLTEQEAIAIGKRDAMKSLEDKLPEGSQIISQKVWRRQTVNGIVKLIINYVVYENIAQAKPIIQGD